MEKVWNFTLRKRCEPWIVDCCFLQIVACCFLHYKKTPRQGLKVKPQQVEKGPLPYLVFSHPDESEETVTVLILYC